MKKEKVLTVLLIGFLILMVVGVTYAFFRAPITKTNQTVTTTTGTLELVFTDNNSIGFSDVINFGDTRVTRFSIENTGTIDTSATIYWKNIVNSYLSGSLVYKLSYGEEGTSESNYEVAVLSGNVPRSASAKDIAMLENIEIPANTKYNYVLEVTLVNSPDVNQTADLNASFYSEFTIKEYNYSPEKTLAILGLEVTESTPQNPGFGYPSPYTSASAECSYNGSPVNTVNGTEETCGNVLEATLGASFKYYDISYYNDLLAPMNATLEYVGEAVWDPVNETCTYNNETVYLLHPLIAATPVQVEGKGKGCSQVYSIVDNNQQVIATGTGIKRVGPGTYGIVEQPSGIYSYEDDYGTSYYFRGNLTNNYVKFGKYPTNYKIYTSSKCTYKPCETPSLELCEKAHGVGSCTSKSNLANSDMYWRIVRINGDGSMRLLYDGTSIHTNGETSNDRMALTNVAWDITNKSQKKDVKYTGYMYGGKSGVASTSKEEAQRNETPSFAKEVLETWYENTFVGTKYEQYISDEIFCNDRSIPTVNGELAPSSAPRLIRFTTYGYGKNITSFGTLTRWRKNENPSLLCSQKNDAFTAGDTINGNGVLKYSIGLITGDEARLAGLIISSSSPSAINNYLARNQRYWNFSPGEVVVNENAYMGIINLANVVNTYWQSGGKSETSLAPVINIGAEHIGDFVKTEVSPGVIVYELN